MELDSSNIHVISFLVVVSTALQYHDIIGSPDTLRIDYGYRLGIPSLVALIKQGVAGSAIAMQSCSGKLLNLLRSSALKFTSNYTA